MREVHSGEYAGSERRHGQHDGRDADLERLRHQEVRLQVIIQTKCIDLRAIYENHTRHIRILIRGYETVDWRE